MGAVVIIEYWIEPKTKLFLTSNSVNNLLSLGVEGPMIMNMYSKVLK